MTAKVDKKKLQKGELELRFEHWRQPLMEPEEELSASERAQILDEGGALEEREVSMAEAGATKYLRDMEMLDVVDAATDEVKYQFILANFENGIVYRNGTTDAVAYVIQTMFDDQGDKKLAQAMARAYAEAKKRLGIKQKFYFYDDADDGED